MNTSQYFLIPGMMRIPNVELIIQQCAASLNVEVKEVKSTIKRRHVKYARWFVWRIMRSHRYRLIDCAHATNNLEHDTILRAMKKIDADICGMPDIQIAWDKVKHLAGIYPHNRARYGKVSRKGNTNEKRSTNII